MMIPKRRKVVVAVLVVQWLEHQTATRAAWHRPGWHELELGWHATPSNFCLLSQL